MNKRQTTIAYLGLGSNVGDRLTYLADAEKELSENPNTKILKVSEVYETEPWPATASGEKTADKTGWFLNQAIQIETVLTPEELLTLCKSIEKKIGRVTTHHWGPREIDLDIVLYGNETVDTPDLKIPHPQLERRAFVLVPLLEIEPQLRRPSDGVSYQKILKALDPTLQLHPYLPGR